MRSHRLSKRRSEPLNSGGKVTARSTSNGIITTSCKATYLLLILNSPYTAKSIAALRNIGFKIEYPSSAQGRKLWKILNEHNKNGTYELTFGTTEPLIAKEMAKHR